MKNVAISILAIQGRSAEENDHAAEVWVHIDEDFEKSATRVMLLREDGTLNLIAFTVEALYGTDYGDMTPMQMSRELEDIDVDLRNADAAKLVMDELDAERAERRNRTVVCLRCRSRQPLGMGALCMSCFCDSPDSPLSEDSLVPCSVCGYALSQEERKDAEMDEAPVPMCFDCEDDDNWCRECLMVPVLFDGDECDRCIRESEAVSMGDSELVIDDTLAFGFVPEFGSWWTPLPTPKRGVCGSYDCHESQEWHDYGGSDTPTPCDTCEQPLSYDEKLTGDFICKLCLSGPKAPRYMRRCGLCNSLIHVQTGTHEMGAKCVLAR